MPSQDKQGSGRRDSLRSTGGPLAASSSARPLTIRTRLNSLRSVSSPQKVTSSSVLTLQGPKRTYAPLRPLSPTYSRPSPSSPSSGADGGSEGEEEEEEMRKLEEEERRIEEQVALERKLKDLELKMTRDALGLVSPLVQEVQENTMKRDIDRGRVRPLSTSSPSSSLHQRLEMGRVYSPNQTPSHHSLSSASSPQGSIPDIPSPPPEPRSPIPRHLSPPGPSRSPPAISHGNAWGTLRGPPATGKTRVGGNVRSERGSEIGSTASSISDYSGQSPINRV